MQQIISQIKDFNLEHIFDCGQCFRWERQNDGSYVGTAMGRIARMSYDGSSLTIDNCSSDDMENIWKNYLDLDTDYGMIKQSLSKEDPTIKTASDYGYGIRILKQDFWETVVSFIISQNNNIPRIKGCIESLCSNFGAETGKYAEKNYYDIPEPKVMANLSVEDLAPVRLGYRARYLIETARQMIQEGGPQAVKNRLLSEPDPIKELCRFSGIGPKVASCIALFGLGRTDAFPIDVWMRRVMKRLYGIDENDIKSMKKYADDHFGRYGGIAQQYLFYYIRSL